MRVRTDIANPKFEVEFDEQIEVTFEENEKIYSFSVKNYETDENQKQNISEVDLEYFVQILADTDSRIKYELYKDKELIDIDDNFSSDYIKMAADNLIEHNYELKIIYEKTNYSEDIMKEAEVKVYCRQSNII